MRMLGKVNLLGPTWLLPSFFVLACTGSGPATASRTGAPATVATVAHAPDGAKAPVTFGAAFTESSLAAGGKPAAKKLLTVPEARRYMLALINRDRATQKLPPVELDEGAAQTAGQRHAEDMAKHGFLGHWGTDGSVPEQRYTEAGGADFVQENALCFTDQKGRTLDARPLIDSEALDKSEAMFFNEVPPNDGHRKNILKPYHKKVGIGVAQPRGTDVELPVPCFAQEFIDSYGQYAPLPKKAKLGGTVRIEGTMHAPATFGGIGVARAATPRPIPVAELNTRRSYPVPNPYQMYWPPGFRTPIPIQVNGKNFALDLPLSDGGKAGMYEVSIWARVPGSPDFVMVSLRTLRVE
ncbi:CAP domain-containing protein [Pendulispora albinea]|uniref:CAP domain-containing protein n=1 Tax=Pendulispora albinea TaxID=2741071 RepID=A0ABZ2M9A9_9BACT